MGAPRSRHVPRVTTVGTGATRVGALVAIACVLMACGDGPGEDAAPEREAPPAESRTAADTPTRDSAEAHGLRSTLVFRCAASSGETFRFEAWPRDGRVELWLPGRFERRTVALEQVRAASGARYEREGVLFWNRGDEALLRVDDEEYRGCTLDRGGRVWAEARRRGVDFRASGNEPGWYLELRRGDSLHLVYDYGEGELTVAAPQPEVQREQERVVYESQTPERDLRLTIEAEPCVDMAGTEYPKTVTVELDGKRYRGCGRWLDGGPE